MKEHAKFRQLAVARLREVPVHIAQKIKLRGDFGHLSFVNLLQNSDQAILCLHRILCSFYAVESVGRVSLHKNIEIEGHLTIEKVVHRTLQECLKAPNGKVCIFDNRLSNE